MVTWATDEVLDLHTKAELLWSVARTRKFETNAVALSLGKYAENIVHFLKMSSSPPGWNSRKLLIYLDAESV